MSASPIPWLLALAGTVASPVHGVLFWSTGDPAYHTTAPTGPLTNSGWQWQGTWGPFLGTPVHREYFITAFHVGGAVGQPFTLRGQTYTAAANSPVPGTDLRLWRIRGEFPDHAPLLTQPLAPGDRLVWFGRGTDRGTSVVFTNHDLAELRGWAWGAANQVLRWGENEFVDVYQDSSFGPMLRATFDAESGPNECHLSAGDSGGAAFAYHGGAWKLAGIHYSVDGPYSYGDAGPGFNAALFDHAGFYWQDGTNWVPTVEEPGVAPSSLYTSDIAAHADAILALLAQPILQAATHVDGPYTDVDTATADVWAQTVTAPIPTADAFYRLRADRPTRILRTQVAGSRLVFDYE